MKRETKSRPNNTIFLCKYHVGAGFSPARAAIMISFLIATILLYNLSEAAASQNRNSQMMDIEKTSQRIKEHLTQLTITIGERSVRLPVNLQRTVKYIESFYQSSGLAVQRETYEYEGMAVANLVSEIAFTSQPKNRFLIGAHYDSVMGTVGADDNASAVAVQLETARQLKALVGKETLDLSVKFVFFALEEPPVYGTRYMGSRVYAKKARSENEKIDGMICLEMVGYACYERGCQGYPFPLMFFGYPKQGDFIGIVGNFKSKKFTRSLVSAFSKNTELPVVKLNVPLNGRILPSIRLSDHASFWDQGFKAVMITDSAFYRNPYYHTALDTMEKLDYRFMAELVESLIMFFRSFRK
jgi:Zn-dependent M28 family amino/carboxypeptidase